MSDQEKRIQEIRDDGLRGAISELNGLLDGYLCAGDVSDSDTFLAAVKTAIRCIKKCINKKPLTPMTCEGCYRDADNKAGFFKIACQRCIRNKNEQLGDFYSIAPTEGEKPVTDCVERRALIEKFEKLKGGADLRDTLYICGVQAVIDNFPAADLLDQLQRERQEPEVLTCEGCEQPPHLCKGCTRAGIKDYYATEPKGEHHV